MVTFGQIEDKMLKILSGDGVRIESAILFEPSTTAERIASEYEFICQKFGREDADWTRGVHFTVVGDNGLCSLWNVELENNRRVEVYFDTSSVTDRQ